MLCIALVVDRQGILDRHFPDTRNDYSDLSDLEMGAGYLKLSEGGVIMTAKAYNGQLRFKYGFVE